MLGATALVRASGIPCSMWTAAGGSGLFGRVVEHADAVERQAGRARRLAEELSGVVPDPRLTDTERRAVLALRRRLHAGSAPTPADRDLLTALTAAPGELVREATKLCDAAGPVRGDRAALEREIAEEHERVAALGWSLVSEGPVLREFLDTASPGLVAEVTARLAAGESWSGKRLRKRSAYLWRALGRAAVKTTPRGWVGQVAPVPVGGPTEDGAGDRLLTPGAELAGLAAAVVENVHTVRTRTGGRDLRTADPATALALAPLHLTEGGGDGAGGTLRCYAIDPDHPGRLRQTALRRTALLDRLLTLFADGPRTLAELESALPGADPAVLRGFLTHLMGLGVLQLCEAPRRHHTPWSPAARVAETGELPRPEDHPEHHPEEPEHGPGDADRCTKTRTETKTETEYGSAGSDRPAEYGPGSWFLDSHRGLSAHVPGPAAARVQRALRTAHRLAALRLADRETGSDAPPPVPGTERLDGRPRPVGELLAEALAPDERSSPGPGRRRHPGWHPAHDPASGYARLLAHLAARADAPQVDVDDALLDALGAPPAEDAVPPWPLDCLLRPMSGPGPLAVLETASPAGIIDARFAEALRALHGGYDTVDAYRDFLAGVERRSGVRFVELLVPSVTGHAANTVRRPVLTRWWTGDPNPAAYFAPGGPEQRYLPLDRITLRRSGRRIVAEADGVRVVPVYHATRNPMPPYDRLARLLLAAGHPWAGTVLCLDGLAAAFPAGAAVTRAPRVTAGRDLVVCPATWRVPRALLWRREDDGFDRVRALASLRRTAGLPRFVFVRPAFGDKPVPADLDALTALNVIERICAAPGDELVLEEMLPGPEAGPRGPVLRDALHRGEPVAAGLLLRLPFDRTPQELAAPAAALAHDVPGPSAPGAAAAGAANTQQGSQRKQEEAPCPSWNSPTSTP
ncbi:lantibiotic dehydratase [Streptomyces sp. NPDC057496]|uniref:lantibiotic dehydratase n=1 Tax=Streptomyces sp. NPDC057496 TaxID=3346149 RepID=UPI0036B3B3FA